MLSKLEQMQLLMQYDRFMRARREINEMYNMIDVLCPEGIGIVRPLKERVVELGDIEVKLRYLLKVVCK